MKQSPSSKIRESKLWHIKEQFGRGLNLAATSALGHVTVALAVSRLQFQNWTPRPSTNSPMTCDPLFFDSAVRSMSRLGFASKRNPFTT